MKKQVLVINYHKIDALESSAASPIDQRFSVTKESFEKQLDILARNNVTLVTLNDLVSNRLSTEFSVAITVDDGYASDHEIVYPLLKARSMPAAFFWLCNDENNARWKYAADMARDGFIIGAHGISHQDLTKMAPAEQLHELGFSKKYIEEKTGSPVAYFALPYGLYNRKTLELVKQAGYTAACTTDVKLNCAEEPFLIHRWNVKRNTSPREFEAMVCNKKLLRYKIKTTQLKSVIKRILGRKIISRLSILFNI